MSPSTAGGTPIWPLFQTVSSASTNSGSFHPPLDRLSSPQSIIQVILVSIAGYVLTLRGFLDKATQRVSLLCLWSLLLSSCCFKQLNVINVNFFTPYLLFSKVALSFSSSMLTLTRPTFNLCCIDKLQELWIIPVFFILVSGVSLVISKSAKSM